MDVLLRGLTSQAMNYAIRSGITITTTYAINQCSRLVKQTPRNHQHRQELLELQLRLESKIRIISPAIDMIELISARGNSTLESTVSLTKEIRFEIQRLGARVAQSVAGDRTKSREKSEAELLAITSTIRLLLAKIEDAIPLINLAITTSGVNLSTKLSGTISPSRLLQASTFLTAADSKYIASVQSGKLSRQQVGPTWTLSLYMLFAGHANRAVDEAGIRETTWKEVVHKARVKLVRVPLEDVYDLSNEKRAKTENDLMQADGRRDEFAYQLVIIEDLDDDRVHTLDDDSNGARPSAFEDVPNAGILDVVPIHEVSKIFYADTGKILNIGNDDDVNSPVLLMKRDVHAEPPRRMLHRSQMSSYPDAEFASIVSGDDDQSQIDMQIHREATPRLSTHSSPNPSMSNASQRLPVDLDPEWLALEVFPERPDTESDEEDEVEHRQRPSNTRGDSLGSNVTQAFSSLRLKSPSPQANGQLSASFQPVTRQIVRISYRQSRPLSPFLRC